MRLDDQIDRPRASAATGSTASLCGAADAAGLYDPIATSRTKAVNG